MPAAAAQRNSALHTPTIPDRAASASRESAAGTQASQQKRRCLKKAKAGHERQRLFPQHFWASENRVQKERHSRNYFHEEFPSGMSYKPAGKDDGIFRPLPKRLFWILWCRWRMLRARLNSSHSAATFVLPRSRKRRKSRSCFTYAKLPSA